MFRELRKRIQSENFRESFDYGTTLGDPIPRGTDELAYDLGRCVPFVVAFSLACAFTYAIMLYHP